MDTRPIDPILAVASLLAQLDPNPTREGLKETPARVCKSLQELTQGYHVDPKKLLKTFEDGANNYDEIVFLGGTPIYSLCEHHIIPFFGVAHIAYIPKGRIVGLSKLARLAECFAQRLQVQERMTRQIADTIQEVLEPVAVGVVLRCRHLCIEARGTKKSAPITYTSALLGAFKDEGSAREEFMKFVQLADSRIPHL